jgi:hypothetical protein
MPRHREAQVSVDVMGTMLTNLSYANTIKNVYIIAWKLDDAAKRTAEIQFDIANVQVDCSYVSTSSGA